MSDSFDLIASVDGLLSLALKQDATLQTKASPIALAIIGLPAEERSIEADKVFARFYGPRVQAKRAGRPEEAKNIGKAWNRARAALAYHFKLAGLAVEWRNIASGESATRVITLEDAKAEREAARGEREEREAAAVAEATAANEAAKLEAMRELGPADLASNICAMVAAWGGNAADVWKALGLVPEETYAILTSRVAALEAEIVAVTAPPAKAEKPARQAAVTRN